LFGYFLNGAIFLPAELPRKSGDRSQRRPHARDDAFVITAREAAEWLYPSDGKQQLNGNTRHNLWGTSLQSR
jgi:hypothetical protein